MNEDIKNKPQAGERIAKRIARAGVASRREAERLIDAGRVTVNGETIRSPALDVGPDDAIVIDGTPVPKPERTRLWRYHKPAGLLVSRTDPRGRRTIYMELPPELGHAISVGRLDFNSEGLLLLTNDGEMARKLELPTEGLVRRYRARAFGHIDQKALDRLKNGITVDGVRYGPIDARLEEARGANAWIALSLTEGKNREVRNVLRAVGLHVNRLIRTHYGPFALGDMPPGAVAEVPAASLMRDLGVASARPKGWAKAKPKLKQRPGKNARLAARQPGERPRHEPPAAERREHRPGDRRPSGNLHRDSTRPGEPRRDGERTRAARASENRPAPARRDDRAARPSGGGSDAGRDAKRPFPNRRGDSRPEQGRRNLERPYSRGPETRAGADRTEDRRFAGKREDRPASNRPNADRRDQRAEQPRGHRPGDRRPSGNLHREPTRAGEPKRDEKRSQQGRRGAERPFSQRREDRAGAERPNAPRQGAARNEDRRFGGKRDDRPGAERPRSARPAPDRPRSEHQGPRGPRRGPNADRRR